MTTPAEPLSHAEVEELRRLYEKATKGEWERDYQRHYEPSDRQHYIEHFITAPARDRVCTANHTDAQEIAHDECGVFEDEQARRDLDLVAALHNAFPRLLASVPRWIPVTERLPEDDGGKTYVLVAWTELGMREYREYASDLFTGVDVANTAFVCHNAPKGWFTHWRSLPPKPDAALSPSEGA